MYAQHDCAEAYKKDNQVPVCPLCSEPIAVKKGDSPDVIVGRHIDNDCQSDTAKEKRKVLFMSIFLCKFYFVSLTGLFQSLFNEILQAERGEFGIASSLTVIY
jgi:hypothetical protein